MPLLPILFVSVAGLQTLVRATYLAPFAHCHPRPGSECLQLSRIPWHFPERSLPGRTLTTPLSEDDGLPAQETPSVAARRNMVLAGPLGHLGLSSNPSLACVELLPAVIPVPGPIPVVHTPERREHSGEF
jgi:hypothetical protein